MADLTNANSSWAAGTTDTASSLTDNVDQTHAQHINGPNSAVVAIENALGAKASLIGSKTDLATRLAVQMGSDGTVIPPGVIWQYGASSAPTGWLLCDGSAVSRTTYNALYLIIGTTFGAGDGSTTFNVPDCRGIVPVGAGQGSGLTNRLLAAKGGAEDAVVVSHTHTDSGHNHSYSTNSTTNSVGTGTDPNGMTTAAGATTGSGSAVISTTGVSGTGKNMMPFLVLYYIIKT